MLLANSTLETRHEIRHFHICCGIGGGKKGFNNAHPRLGNTVGVFRCIGGIDINPSAIKDFNAAGPGNPGTVLDLFTRSQYVAFHGKEPPKEWREATPEDIREAAGNERPDIVFISTPCKGASGLLSQERSKEEKYQALNELTLRCIWLMSEAWKEDPVDLVLFENVPLLATRGRHLLDQITQLLQHYGYACAETVHNCGELGGMAQSRKRFLLVARHTEKVPPHLYEPEKKRFQSVGSLLDRMPVPGTISAGPMHRLPSLQWNTWVRLAFVEAGNDWHSLKDNGIQDGTLGEYMVPPCSQNGTGPYGVHRWQDVTGTIAGRSGPTNGAYSISDPRRPVMDGTREFDIITSQSSSTGICLSGGGISVREKGIGTNWQAPSAKDRLTAVIQQRNGTYHRPFTTLEVAVLQSLVEPEEYFVLDGLSDQAWRERIGNAVPPAAATAIAEVMGTTLLLARAGETFVLSATPVWVRPVAIGIAISTINETMCT